MSLDAALARRTDILARIDAAQGPAERSQLRNTALPGVDEQVGRFQGQLAGLQADLQQLELAFAVLPRRPAITAPCSVGSASTGSHD